MTEKTRITTIGPWDSSRYGHKGNPPGPDFEVSIEDHLDQNGQVFVSVRPDGSNTDNLLSTMVEIASHPETEQPVPVVRVYRGDDCVASIYAGEMDKVLLAVSRIDVARGWVRIRED